MIVKMIQGYSTPEVIIYKWGRDEEFPKQSRTESVCHHSQFLKKKKKKWKVLFMWKAKSHKKKSGSVWEEMFQW